VVFLGLLAGALTTGCWLPQLLRAWRTRSTGDLSWLYLVVLSAGIALWLAYGVANRDVAIVATNGLTLAAVVILGSLKVRFDARYSRGVVAAESFEGSTITE
jgi:MtN3 and saliva related transmembrane protein